MVIEDVQPAHAQPGTPRVEVDLEGSRVHLNQPEHVVRVHVHVVIVNLFGEVSRSDRTGVQVESNKDERAHTLAAVDADVLALNEAHVRLVGQILGKIGSGVRSDPAAEDMGLTHESVEVGDPGKVVDCAQWLQRIQTIVVDEDPEGLKWSTAPGNRVRPVTFNRDGHRPVVSQSRLRRQKAGSQYSARTCQAPKECSP